MRFHQFLVFSGRSLVVRPVQCGATVLALSFATACSPAEESEKQEGVDITDNGNFYFCKLERKVCDFLLRIKW